MAPIVYLDPDCPTAVSSTEAITDHDDLPLATLEAALDTAALAHVKVCVRCQAYNKEQEEFNDD